MMARPHCREFFCALFSVISRGSPCQRIVTADRDWQAWQAVLGQVAARFGWQCHAFCLTDNHYHLLIATPQPNLSRGMQQFNGATPKFLTAVIAMWGISFKGDSSPFWWRRSRACWNSAAMWC